MRDARATRNRSAGRLVHLALTLSVSSLAMSDDAEQARAQSAEAAVTEVVDVTTLLW